MQSILGVGVRGHATPIIMSANVEAGTDCYGKTFSMGSKGIVAGKPLLLI